MEQKTRIYLNYLNGHEAAKMTDALNFLRKEDKSNKREFLKLTNELYGKEVKLNFVGDNGRMPSQWRAYTHYGKQNHFYIVMQFERKTMHEEAIKVLGANDETFDWRYFYGIAVCEEDRKMYVLSYSNQYSPNWNEEYKVQNTCLLEDVDFPILQISSFIYRMDDALHAAINAILIEDEPTYVEENGKVKMVIKDQHGNYTDIEGATIDEVFRDFANNYTGYKSYRRQMASEWEIVNDEMRQRFDEWKKTARGLKSDFDKFYGGGIVD